LADDLGVVVLENRRQHRAVDRQQCLSEGLLAELVVDQHVVGSRRGQRRDLHLHGDLGLAGRQDVDNLDLLGEEVDGQRAGRDLAAHRQQQRLALAGLGRLDGGDPAGGQRRVQQGQRQCRQDKRPDYGLPPAHPLLPYTADLASALGQLR
jgi:hypothetical protein